MRLLPRRRAVSTSVIRLVVRSDNASTRALAYLTIGLDLAVLAYFKYLEFIVMGLVVPLIGSVPISRTTYGNSPGISFYTFQMVAFLFDTLANRSRGAPTFVDYVNFASFFPQVVAGPIDGARNCCRRWSGSGSDFLGQI